MILTNRNYDILKWITLVLLPSLSVLYLALSQVWTLPFGTEVVGTLSIISLFLAALLGISTSSFRVRNPMYRLAFVKLSDKAESNWVLPNNTYEILTWIAQILLPALSAAYFGLSQIWGFPYGDQVVGTLMAIDAFLGMLLGFSTAQFHKSVAISSVEWPEARLVP